MWHTFRVRHLFPALKRFAYLNAAASSPLATPVADAAVAVLREAEAQADVGFPRWLEQKEALRGRLARLLSSRTSEVAITTSTSTGFAAVAELFWRRGVRTVLTLESEFPSTTVPLLARGLQLKVVRPRPDGTYRVEDFDGGDAVALSAVQFGSGFVIDLPAVKAYCRGRRLPLAVNVAQTLGQVPFDVDGVDFACGTSHKWLMAGYGLGVLYVRDGWLKEHGLPWASWFAPPEALRWQTFPGSTWQGDTARGAELRTDALALEAGAQWPQFYAFEEALKLIEGVGVPAIHAHNLKLQAVLRAGLEQRGFQPTAPAMSGICVVRVAGRPDDAVRALLRENVVLTARAGGLRFSTHIYNDTTDVQRALEAIDRVKVA
ncbi:MAG: aminotransferase class V-fold PLP-dependent enzyme, partial [Myxococcaceae bacterium]|nr:aminotransferase class V-fold PLP-dependent enzyme [Myxococcaceae bacterium]